MHPVLFILCLATALIASFAGGFMICNDIKGGRAERAENACEELRKVVMKGSSVTRHFRNDNAPNADKWYYHIKTHDGDLLLTIEQFSTARERANLLLK